MRDGGQTEAEEARRHKNAQPHPPIHRLQEEEHLLQLLVDTRASHEGVLIFTDYLKQRFMTAVNMMIINVSGIFLYSNSLTTKRKTSRWSNCVRHINHKAVSLAVSPWRPSIAMVTNQHPQDTQTTAQLTVMRLHPAGLLPHPNTKQSLNESDQNNNVIDHLYIIYNHSYSPGGVGALTVNGGKHEPR